MEKAYLLSKIMLMVWYSDRPDIFTWQEGLTCTVRLGPMARTLGTTNYRLKDYFARLEQHGVIKDLKAKYSQVSFTVQIPKPIEREVMGNV